MADATVFVQDPTLPVHRAAAVGDTLVDGSGNPLGGGVPTTRSVATTAPLTGGGTLASDLTLAVSTFDSGDAGVVPASGGGTSNYLRADGTWDAPPGTAGAVSSVFTRTGAVTAQTGDYTAAQVGAAPTTRSLATTAPLGGGGDLSADRTLTVANATTLAVGVVQLAGDLGGTATSPTVPGLAAKAPLASPVLTGTPTAPTASPGTANTQVATTAYADAAVAAAVVLLGVKTILNGTTSYTPTVGTKALYVECIGAGGAGGGAATSSSTSSVGGGGGGGAYSTLYTTTIKTYTVAVGAGGTGVSGTTGNTGGDTTFDSPSVCTAKGGVGGTTLAAGTSVLAILGGLGGAVGSGVGDRLFGGSPGAPGMRFSASAGVSGTGAPGPLAGGGGRAVNTTVTVGGAGQAYGGGGAGSFTATTAQLGGAGANGLLRIWEFA